MLNKTKRRTKQVLDLIMTNKFHISSITHNHYNDRYAHKTEMDYYEKIALDGLDERESIRVDKVLDLVKDKNKALVVGCGTGREVFQFQESFKSVYGIDTCKPMIDAAKKIAMTNGVGKDQDQDQFKLIKDLGNYDQSDFDFIYLTVTLMNHMKGRDNRVSFYKELGDKLSHNGYICGFSNILPLKWNQRFYWVSHLLRLKSFLSSESWEPGDSVRSYLGSHTKLNFPIFYHFDQSKEAILGELSNAGLVGEFIFNDFWVAQKRSLI